MPTDVRRTIQYGIIIIVDRTTGRRGVLLLFITETNGSGLGCTIGSTRKYYERTTTDVGFGGWFLEGGNGTRGHTV